ncbi:MAG: RING finger domain-containing protein [Candidatus Thorarchaeota archaeon]
MNLFNNDFIVNRKISSFSKEQITEIKQTINKLKSERVDTSEINDYIINRLNTPFNIFEPYSQYLNEMKSFFGLYLVNSTSSDRLDLYFHLKSRILKELNQIIENLQIVSSNCSNIKRITKNGFPHLEELYTTTKDLLRQSNDMASNLINSLKECTSLYNDDVYLWIEINRIKNLNFKLNNLPYGLDQWNEYKDLETFLISLNEVFTKRLKISKKESIRTFHFDDIYQFFLSKDEKHINFYSDLIYLLYMNKGFEWYQGDEFINIIERKEVIQDLQNFITPLLTDFILDNLENIFVEFKEFDLWDDLEIIDSESLRHQKISKFFPKIVDLYIKGLEKKFQEKIQDVVESDEFEEIANFYYNKIEEFSKIIEDIENWVLTFEDRLEPYKNITESLKKIFSNLSSEIYRRKNEYLTFIKTVKDEELRISVRKYVDERISQINDLIKNYEDETSLIIREEFPQLKRVKEILSEYNSQIEVIKREVYARLESVKSYDIDIYQIIKLWEDNFNRKRQQLTFLISLLINKLFKSFKELLDKEGILFATITEITEQTENFEELPLNFALSSFLAEKLTEDELRERINEINSKLTHLNNSLGLYQVELSKLETILSNRVKVRKGVTQSDVQCTVCHKQLNFAKDKVITCPFCGSTYHYLCVASWMERYNTCPMCQNHFLEPHSNLFETQEDHEQHSRET